MRAPEIDPRHEPCYILDEYGIQCVVWMEDAIAHYGVPTVVFDLYLLVPDIQIAASTLQERGWKLVSQQHGEIGNAIIDVAQFPQLRLTPPPPPPDSLRTDWVISRQATTVLLPAAEWNYAFTREKTVGRLPIDIFPSLVDLLDALLDSMLDCQDEQLWHHLALQVLYLYGHAQELRDWSFADRLLYEHRQYHFDTLSGMSTGTIPFIRHEREIRDALRAGTRELQECSASRDNKLLFNREEQARLLANMPDPFADGLEDSRQDHVLTWKNPG